MNPVDIIIGYRSKTAFPKLPVALSNALASGANKAKTALQTPLGSGKSQMNQIKNVLAQAKTQSPIRYGVAKTLAYGVPTAAAVGGGAYAADKALTTSMSPELTAQKAQAAAAAKKSSDFRDIATSTKTSDPITPEQIEKARAVTGRPAPAVPGDPQASTKPGALDDVMAYLRTGQGQLVAGGLSTAGGLALYLALRRKKTRKPLEEVEE